MSSFLSFCCFFVAVFEMIELFVTFYGCYSKNPQSFPTEGFSKTNTPYLCLFLRVCSGYGSLVCVVPDGSADPSDFMFMWQYEQVCV